MIKKDFYSVKEVAKILDYSEESIRGYIRLGTIKTEQMKKSARHRIPWLELPTFARRKILEGKKETR